MAPLPQGIPVLMYHALEDISLPEKSGDIGSQIYVVSPGTFLEQMEYLSQNCFTVLLLDELEHLVRWPAKAIVLTFDDGHSSNYTVAFQILKQFGFRAHFFLTTSLLDSPDFLTTQQIQEMDAMGMSIGSHGVTHSFLDDMSETMVFEEMQNSKEFLEPIISNRVDSFSAPGGRFTTSVVTIAKNLGYRIFCTSLFDLLTRKDMGEAIPRLVVKQNTSLQTFVKMVNGDRLFMQKKRGVASLLFALKSILGNRTYVVLRKIVLQIGSCMQRRI